LEEDLRWICDLCKRYFDEDAHLWFTGYQQYCDRCDTAMKDLVEKIMAEDDAAGLLRYNDETN